MKKFILAILFFVVSGNTATFAQKRVLTSAVWRTEIINCSDVLNHDTISLYSKRVFGPHDSYFEFRKNGSFTLYTNRRPEYEPSLQAWTELVTPYKGVYTIKRKKLRIEFEESIADVKTTKTYFLTHINKEEIKLVADKRRG